MKLYSHLDVSVVGDFQEAGRTDRWQLSLLHFNRSGVYFNVVYYAPLKHTYLVSFRECMTQGQVLLFLLCLFHL